MSKIEYLSETQASADSLRHALLYLSEEAAAMGLGFTAHLIGVAALSVSVRPQDIPEPSRTESVETDLPDGSRALGALVHLR